MISLLLKLHFTRFARPAIPSGIVLILFPLAYNVVSDLQSDREEGSLVRLLDET